MKPSDEQIKEFWEWCGWEYASFIINGNTCWGWHLASEEYGFQDYYPYVGLENLFKWAVPKVVGELIMTGVGIRASWEKLFKEWLDFYITGNYEFEDALFWAIWKVIHNEHPR